MNGGQLHVGVVGIGFIGEIQIEAIRRTGLAEVTAIAGHDSNTTSDKAERLNVPKAYDDWRALVDDPDVEVVHVCTPNNLHFEIVERAVSAKKHVVCEKPFTMTSDEARHLVELARDNGIVNAIHYNVRYYPLVRESRFRVSSGGLGTIYDVHGSYLQDWLLHDTDYSWRIEPELSGPTRAVSDIGTHWLDLTEYVTGSRVNAVCANLATFLPKRKKPKEASETWSGKLERSAEDFTIVDVNTEDFASLLLHYENGAHGTLVVSQMAAGRKNRVSYEINGSASSLTWNSERPNELEIGYRDRPNEVLIRDPALMMEPARSIVSYPSGHNEGFADTSKQLFREVYRYILSDRQKGKQAPLFPTFEDGLRGILLCEAIEKSARNRSWVSIADR